MRLSSFFFFVSALCISSLVLYWMWRILSSNICRHSCGKLTLLWIGCTWKLAELCTGEVLCSVLLSASSVSFLWFFLVLRPSFTRSLAHSRTRSLAHSLAHSLTHSLTHSVTHLVTHLIARSFIGSLTHSFTHSLNRSLAHSVSNWLTHSSSFFLFFSPHNISCFLTNVFRHWTDKENSPTVSTLCWTVGCVP